MSRGLDAGFSIAQIRLLWKASNLAGMERQGQIYWSLDQLDRCIHVIIEKYGLLKKDSRPGDYKVILKQLFEYRKKVEFNKPHYRMGIRTTRDIPVDQLIKIRDNHVGIYNSKIEANTEGYLTITYPSGEPLPMGFSWRGRLLNIYFWREGDAGYFFETKLKEHYQDRDEHRLLRLNHSDYLLRSQKRRSVRAQCSFPAQIYRFKSSQSFSHTVETNPGVYGLVVDLSEDGAAVRVAGKANKGTPVKIQFKIKDIMIVLNGVIKSLHYDRSKDQSVLHLECIPPEDKSHFAILAYVYDVDRSRFLAEKNEREKLDDSSMANGNPLVPEEEERFVQMASPVEVEQEDPSLSDDDEDMAELEELS
ncbi:MAG: PilZ domain-containing protein [Spirochaetaceae bacterium]|nr:PilZ domain-containing protein [Spirochaetaceae bacterium]